MSDIVERLRTPDPRLGVFAIQFEAADEIERLTQCAAALEQIRQVCADNAGEGSNHKMALDFVHQIAIRALKEQHNGNA